MKKIVAIAHQVTALSVNIDLFLAIYHRELTQYKEGRRLFFEINQMRKPQHLPTKDIQQQLIDPNQLHIKMDNGKIFKYFSEKDIPHKRFFPVYKKTTRLLINHYLTQEQRVSLFTQKLNQYKDELLLFLTTLFPNDEITDYTLVDITDVSSSRITWPNQVVYILNLNINGRTEKIVLKQCKNKETAKKEYFASEYLRLFDPAFPLQISPPQEKHNVIFMNCLDGVDIGTIFEQGTLKPTAAQNLTTLIKQLAFYACYFDCLLKGDRSLGIDGSGGNFIVADDQITPIDSEWIFNSEDKYVKRGYSTGDSELAVLLTLPQDAQANAWDLFITTYEATIPIVQEIKADIIHLINRVFPGDKVKTKIFEFMINNLSDTKSRNAWIKMMENGLTKSRAAIAKIHDCT